MASALTINDMDTEGDYLEVQYRSYGEGYFSFDAYEDEDSAEVHISLDDARRLVAYLQQHLPPKHAEDIEQERGGFPAITESTPPPGVWAVLQRLETGAVESVVAIFAQDQEINALRMVNEIGGVYARFLVYGEPVNPAPPRGAR